ncbi:monovalent cation/H+ antiporter subunit E [Halomontanus rarus]|uniref:monovalent cation/H+ antiporter subunit E n=1 Tax=Halomontanus rarus TaxID=3034020 RepID=UPI001A98F3F0
MTTELGSGDADFGFLVPVSDSPTLDETVEYAAREAREVAAETDEHVDLFLVAPITPDGPPGVTDRDDVDHLLERAAAVATDTLEMTDPEGSVDVRTAMPELARYPPNPVEYVDAIVAVADEREIETVIVDPDHRMPVETPIGRSIETELRDIRGFDLEMAPVERPARKGRLVTRGGLAQFLSVAGLSFGFYLVLGGFGDVMFDLVTGGVTALLVAGVLSRITFEQTPQPTRVVTTAWRWLLYVPYLLWKIVTANVQIAYVVLHPSLPIDPTMERFEAGVWGGTATTTLANSITLTPGTLTVDVRNREFVVHSLTSGSREDLLDGGLERAVRFVFYGRSAMRYPSPRERLAVNTEANASDGGAETETGTGNAAAGDDDGTAGESS